MSGFQDEAIRRIQEEGSDPEGPRRRHYVKMGIAAALTLACFGLFAAGALGEGRTERGNLKAASREEALKVIARISGPELGALLVGGASGIWLLVLTLRLQRLD